MSPLLPRSHRLTSIAFPQSFGGFLNVSSPYLLEYKSKSKEVKNELKTQIDSKSKTEKELPNV